MEYRIERDSMGEVRVPADKLWGAQTQRSLENFPIGGEVMPREVIHAFGAMKLAAARVNARLVPQKMTAARLSAIEAAARELTEGALDEHFPLVVWQTGSGTQTNMNVNEVLANRGNAIAGAPLLHPNDHVNMSQSSNDTFPTAMHIAALVLTERRLMPALEDMVTALRRLEEQNRGIIKSGRTHLEDATPIAFSQEISGWRASLEVDLAMVADSLEHLRSLALGATAVGTGLNAPEGFDVAVAEELSSWYGTPFRAAENKFHALTSKGELVSAHGVLKAVAADLMKMANDIRWLASGPRCGLSEIFINENEPGSSIMPGKVNPTQCEAMTMVAVQVMANDVAVGVAASGGNFQLNVFMPVCIYNYLQSVRLLADACDSFRLRCVSGIRANAEKMAQNLHGSLMTATALSPHIGYEATARLVKLAHEEGLTLREANARLGAMSEAEFDRVYHPEEMV